MANRIYKIIHKHSKDTVIDSENETNAKAPNANDIEYGELAVNYAEGSETIFMRNSGDKVVEFRSGKHMIPQFWKGTLKEYVAIKDKDPDTIYFILEDTINQGEQD